MPMIETISIVNKGGKIVSSSKHIVNLFKDAKDAYQEKKAEIRAEIKQKDHDRLARQLRDINLDDGSRAGSSRHERHHSASHDKGKGRERSRRPPLTEGNLSHVSEGSVTSSRRRSSSHQGERSPRSPKVQSRSPQMYHAPYFENADISRPDLLARRHTERNIHESSVVSRGPPPSYGPPKRSYSDPNFAADDIDMHLAYGDIPPPLPFAPPHSMEKEQELQGLMSKLDKLMVEAQCIQHSASTVIASLQANPEAMAAVALTLAEISNIIAKMSPGILTAIKGGSPMIFALLASPQFLIAGGLAVGVTIVMFGGYKIIKKIQKDIADKKEANRMDEALVFEGELGSIEHWRRGIAEVEAQSVATSIDGEFITPEASRIRKERIRDRAREERKDHAPTSLSVAGSTTSTVRRKEVPPRTSSRAASSVSGSVRGERLEKEMASKAKKEAKALKKKEEKKPKKPSALVVLFKKNVEKKAAAKRIEASKAREDEGTPPNLPKRLESSHVPKLIDM